MGSEVITEEYKREWGLVSEVDNREQDKTFRQEWGIRENTPALQAANSIPMTAADFRAKADKHDRTADGLVSGESKDSHIIAARKNKLAADLIDAAHLAGRKAEAFD